LLESQLRDAQQLTALGELLSTTTHEFNNILTTIINYAKLGLRYQDAPSRDKSFQRILDAGNRAAKITSSILAVARNRKTEAEPTNLAELVEDSLVLLEREMSKYRVLITKQFEPAPLALVAGNQLQQVILNLLINARQAMPQGGQLLIRVSHDTKQNMVDLTVRDTGMGIPAEQLPKIFDRFYTTKRPDEFGKGGTGLGLAFCRDVIEAHHGRIRVESAPGKGTAFTLKLPVAAQPLPIVMTPIATTQPAPLPAK